MITDRWSGEPHFAYSVELMMFRIACNKSFYRHWNCRADNAFATGRVRFDIWPQHGQLIVCESE